MRYLIALWPLLALLTGVGLRQLAGAHRRLVAVLLTLWLVLGVSLALTSDLRYELGYFSQSSIHRLMPVMIEQISPSDFLIQDYHVAALDTRRYYARLLGVDWATMGRFQEDPFESIRPVHAAYPYAWLLYLTKDRVGFAELPQALGRVFCERALEEWGLTLERYALHSVENCPDRPVRLEFEREIRLTAPEITLGDGRLRLDAHFRSVDETLLARYSLAVHVIDPRSGQRIAQGDTWASALAPSSRCAAKSTFAPCRRANTSCTSGSMTGRPANGSWRATSRPTKSATCTCCNASASANANSLSQGHVCVRYTDVSRAKAQVSLARSTRHADNETLMVVGPVPAAADCRPDHPGNDRRRLLFRRG